MEHFYITGAIGSGKTTLAETLSRILHRKVLSLDALFFDLESSIHRKKKEPLQRDKELLTHLAEKNMIFEGWHLGDWLIPLVRSVSLVVIVDTPLELRLQRIENRFNRRKAGLEFDPFPNSDPKHLSNLFKWTKMFDANESEKEIRKHCSSECLFLRDDGFGKVVGKITQQTAPLNGAGGSPSP
jgi:dephospho-CoA kinase